MTTTRFTASLIVAGICGLLVLGIAGGQEKFSKAFQGEKPPKDFGAIEDKAVQKVTEKVFKPGETEREKWLDEMKKVYRGQASPGLSDADFAQWFDLLSNNGPEWRREFAPRKDIAELFDRTAERLNLGPNDGIRRAAFISYARYNLLPGTSPPWKPADPRSAADKVFRELDRDGSGILEPFEWTERLNAESRRVDANRDGRIDPVEYQTYFEGRVTASLDPRGPEPIAPSRPNNASPPTAEPKPVAIRAGHLPPGLPDWFVTLDSDRDGQIALHEWRSAGHAPADFEQLDLNTDGLVPPDEYLRGMEQARVRQYAEARAEGEPPPIPMLDRGNGRIKKR